VSLSPAFDLILFGNDLWRLRRFLHALAIENFGFRFQPVLQLEAI
jgi:hypothetical protein